MTTRPALTDPIDVEVQEDELTNLLFDAFAPYRGDGPERHDVTTPRPPDVGPTAYEPGAFARAASLFPALFASQGSVVGGLAGVAWTSVALVALPLAIIVMIGGAVASVALGWLGTSRAPRDEVELLQETVRAWIRRHVGATIALVALFVAALATRPDVTFDVLAVVVALSATAGAVLTVRAARRGAVVRSDVARITSRVLTALAGFSAVVLTFVVPPLVVLLGSLSGGWVREVPRHESGLWLAVVAVIAATALSAWARRGDAPPKRVDPLWTGMYVVMIVGMLTTTVVTSRVFDTSVEEVVVRIETADRVEVEDLGGVAEVARHLRGAGVDVDTSAVVDAALVASDDGAALDTTQRLALLRLGADPTRLFDAWLAERRPRDASDAERFERARALVVEAPVLYGSDLVALRMVDERAPFDAVERTHVADALLASLDEAANASFVDAADALTSLGDRAAAQTVWSAVADDLAERWVTSRGAGGVRPASSRVPTVAASAEAVAAIAATGRTGGIDVGELDVYLTDAARAGVTGDDAPLAAVARAHLRATGLVTSPASPWGALRPIRWTLTLAWIVAMSAVAVALTPRDEPVVV